MLHAVTLSLSLVELLHLLLPRQVCGGCHAHTCEPLCSHSDTTRPGGREEGGDTPWRLWATNGTQWRRRRRRGGRDAGEWVLWGGEGDEYHAWSGSERGREVWGQMLREAGGMDAEGRASAADTSGARAARHRSAENETDNPGGGLAEGSRVQIHSMANARAGYNGMLGTVRSISGEKAHVELDHVGNLIRFRLINLRVQHTRDQKSSAPQERARGEHANRGGVGYLRVHARKGVFLYSRRGKGCRRTSTCKASFSPADAIGGGWGLPEAG